MTNHENKLVRNSLSLISRLLLPNTMAFGCSFSVDVKGIFSSGLSKLAPQHRSAPHSTSDQVRFRGRTPCSTDQCMPLSQTPWLTPSRPLLYATPSTAALTPDRFIRKLRPSRLNPPVSRRPVSRHQNPHSRLPGVSDSAAVGSYRSRVSVSNCPSVGSRLAQHVRISTPLL